LSAAQPLKFWAWCSAKLNNCRQVFQVHSTWVILCCCNHLFWVRYIDGMNVYTVTSI
jgi:hypothetical protein